MKNIISSFDFPRISVVIPNWNGGEVLIECLNSLRGLAYPDYEIIVVDNGSSDGSPELVKKRFPEITLIKNDENLGFAEGNNIGIRHAVEKGSDYIFLVNNDAVADEKVLDMLVKVGEIDHEIGILGPKIYYYDDPSMVWFAGGFINWGKGVPVQRGIGEKNGEKFSEVEEVEYISGCALLIKKEVIEKIGLMDPRFFLYYEETDWCLHAKKSGYRIMFIPQAKVWHKVSLGTGGDQTPLVTYYYVRNNMLFLQKNTSLWYQLTHAYRFFREGVAWPVVVAFRQGNPRRWKIALAAFVGVVNFLIRRFGPASAFLA